MICEYDNDELNDLHTVNNLPVFANKVASSTEPLTGFANTGNCSHVKEDLNSLNILESDMRMTKLSVATTSRCIEKYFPSMGLNKTYKK